MLYKTLPRGSVRSSSLRLSPGDKSPCSALLLTDSYHRLNRGAAREEAAKPWQDSMGLTFPGD